MKDLTPLANLPVAELERAMLELPQAPCGVRHHFVAGLYIREVTIPADTYAIGHAHTRAHVNLFMAGCAQIVTPDGRTVELRAPQMFIGAPGRKVGYIVETVRWLNIWPTDECDVEALEGKLFEQSEAFKDAVRLELPHRDAQRLIGYDREDYQRWLTEMGETQESMSARFAAASDCIPFPPGTYKVKVGHSRLQGRGLIATADIEAGETIAPARIGDYRTPAGRFTNHARDPNARMAKDGNRILLVATRKIEGNRGGFDGEEITVNYRAAVQEALL